jgi:hypothetical protein
MEPYMHGRARDMLCRPVLLLNRPEVPLIAFPRQNARCLDGWFAVNCSCLRGAPEIVRITFRKSEMFIGSRGVSWMFCPTCCAPCA